MLRKIKNKPNAIYSPILLIQRVFTKYVQNGSFPNQICLEVGEGKRGEGNVDQPSAWVVSELKRLVKALQT